MIKKEGVYDIFAYAGKTAIPLPFRGRRDRYSLEPNSAFGLRSSADGKKTRMILLDIGDTIVFSPSPDLVKLIKKDSMHILDPRLPPR